MSLSKKDPSLRVAANDPHLVSLGGGRLSTAVTIHNIPVGDTTIGSSTQCNISLSGSGVRPVHCTIYRSEENQVTLVPERDARTRIDDHLVRLEVDLKQGAMITLGESYNLRYNNPAEALQMRTAMGDLLNGFKNESSALDYFYVTNVNPVARVQDKSDEGFCKTVNNLKPFDINGWQCPKVFTADLVTVNMPAKAVLGQKYANFAKNLAENHRKDKSVSSKNPESLYVNIPMNPTVKSPSDSCEFLTKVQNTSTPQRLGEINTFSKESSMADSKDHLEDMLKICSEYSDRQERSGSLSSSPIVQNRIKTNGSLPRDKKSPFFQEFASTQMQSSHNNSNGSLSASPSKSSGYENVRVLSIEVRSSSKSSGYENVKIVPQSPRTKIRTNCLSPKKDSTFSTNLFTNDSNNSQKPQTNYEYLIKNFEEKFQKEIEAIEVCSRSQSISTSKALTVSANNTPVAKRTNKNINNLTIDIKSFVSPHNSPKPVKKPTPAPRNITKLSKSVSEIGRSPSGKRPQAADDLQVEREDLLRRLQSLKMEISSLQQQDNETLIEMDMENALVLGELQCLNETKQQLEQDYQLLQQKIHRLEAQRNATRVMEENQQAKLKQSIEMKQEQLAKLKQMLQQKPNNECLKEELQNVKESLENDRKSFEDLEFQYLEGESDWQDQKEEMYSAETKFLQKIKDTKMAIENLENQEPQNTTTSEQQKTLRKRLVALLKDLQQCEQEFKELERKLAAQLQDQHMNKPQSSTRSLAIMSQSLFGSTEMLCPKPSTEDLMSQSFNENLIYNNKIETPSRKSQEQLAEGPFRNSREASIKLLDSIKEIEHNRQLLASQQQHNDLEQEKRKIKDILMKLGTERRQQFQALANTEADVSTSLKENKENLKQKRSTTNSYERQQSTPYLIEKSQKPKEQQFDGTTFSQRPLSESSSEVGEDFLPNSNKRKSCASGDHPESPRSVNLNDKRSSSVLSNETSPHGSDSNVSSERRKALAKHQRPLTRYLPIFAQDLDLRRHIESAGHQITLCPHVFLDAYACRGYLQKLGGSTFHTWSKRWFVLDRQRQALIYYSDKSERKPRGGAYFSSIDEVYMDHLNASKSSRPHCTFIVKTKKRLYYLQAASDAAARIWIDAIITGAQGNIDY